jgi:hypothetical protein
LLYPNSSLLLDTAAGVKTLLNMAQFQRLGDDPDRSHFKKRDTAYAALIHVQDGCYFQRTGLTSFVATILTTYGERTKKWGLDGTETMLAIGLANVS